MLEHPWPYDKLIDDFRAAVCGKSYAVPMTRRVGVDIPERHPLTEAQVSEVVRWQVTYHNVIWHSGMNTGTELYLLAVLRLASGEWASVEAWNGYAGWSGSHHSDVWIGASEDEVVRYGLDVMSRRALGYA